jgi:cytochrome c-type biogenesis protein CcmH
LIWLILVAVVVVIGGSWLVAKSLRTRAIVFVAAMLAVGGYVLLGHPDKPDDPLSHRVDELEARLKSVQNDPTKARLGPDELMAIAEKEARADPKNPGPHHAMGYILERTGKASEAVMAYESALRRDPNFTPSMVALADLLFSSSGQVTPDIQKLYQRAHELEPDDLRIGYMVGVGDWEAGKKDEAEKLWASLDAKLPAGDKSLSQLADSFFALSGKVEPYTAEFYQRALARDPTNLRAGYMLGVGEWQAGHEAEAKARWAALAAKAPKGDDTVKTLANDLFKTTGRVDPWTAELFRLAYQQNADDVQVGYFYGIGLWQAGHHAEADALWASIEAKTAPDDPRRQMFAALKEAFRKEGPASESPAAPAPPQQKPPG